MYASDRVRSLENDRSDWLRESERERHPARRVAPVRGAEVDGRIALVGRIRKRVVVRVDCVEAFGTGVARHARAR